MNENIDLTQVLKDCPKGTKFYSTVAGEVEFVEIDCNNPDDILYFTGRDGGRLGYFKNGKLFKDKGECILFPSEKQRDWSKFVPTWETEKEVVKVTLHPFDKVLVRDGSAYPWEARFVAFITDEKIETIGGNEWGDGIPYNRDTAYLLGAVDKCPIDYEIEFSKEFKE